MKEIKVRSKKHQYILHENGTYTKIENFKVGDTFICIKKLRTSEGTIKKNDIYTIDAITFCYFIKCLNKTDREMGYPIKDFNENKHFRKLEKDEIELYLNTQKYNL